MTLSIPVRVNVVWKMRNKRIETSGKPALSPSTGEAILDEGLSMINTLYTKKKTDKVLDKQAVITVQALVEGHGAKRVGLVKLNLSNYKDAAVQNKTFSLTQCPDKYGQITLSIKATPVGGVQDGEDVVSDAASLVSMGTDQNYTGPDLWRQEQDLTGFASPREPEPAGFAHPEEVIKQTPIQQGLPPTVPRSRPQLKTVGPVNSLTSYQPPSEDMKQIQQELEETKAKLSMIERDNSDLKKEKRDIKHQLNEQVAIAKKDRERLIAHIQEQDAKLNEVESIHNKSADKRRGYKRKLSDLKTTMEQMVADMKKLERDRKTALDERDKARSEQRLAAMDSGSMQNEAFQRQIDDLTSEKIKLERGYSNTKMENERLKENVNKLRAEVEESRESMTSRGMEADTIFDNYRKKTESIIRDLKEQVDRSERTKEEAIAKNTDMALEIQRMGSKSFSSSDARVLSLEREVRELKEAKMNMELDLDRERSEKEHLSHKANSDNSAANTKIAQLKEKVSELEQNKHAMERKSYEAELQIRQNELDSDVVGKQLMQEKLDKAERKINRLSKSVDKRKDEIHNLENQNGRISQDLNLAKQQLQTATNTEFSDPATIILQEQVRDFEYKIESQEMAHNSEKSRLTSKITQLNKEIELLERKIKKEASGRERELESLQVDNEILKRQVADLQVEVDRSPKKQSSSENVINSVNETNILQQIQMLKMEKTELEDKLGKETDKSQSNEKRFLDQKILKANLESERDVLNNKYSNAVEQLQDISSQFTKLEVELYRVNEKLGESLNYNNEIEFAYQTLRQEMEAGNNKKGKRKR